MRRTPGRAVARTHAPPLNSAAVTRRLNPGCRLRRRLHRFSRGCSAHLTHQVLSAQAQPQGAGARQQQQQQQQLRQRAASQAQASTSKPSTEPLKPPPRLQPPRKPARGSSKSSSVPAPPSPTARSPRLPHIVDASPFRPGSSDLLDLESPRIIPSLGPAALSEGGLSRPVTVHDMGHAEVSPTSTHAQTARERAIDRALEGMVEAEQRRLFREEREQRQLEEATRRRNAVLEEKRQMQLDRLVAADRRLESLATQRRRSEYLVGKETGRRNEVSAQDAQRRLGLYRLFAQVGGSWPALGVEFRTWRSDPGPERCCPCGPPAGTQIGGG